MRAQAIMSNPSRCLATWISWSCAPAAPSSVAAVPCLPCSCLEEPALQVQRMLPHPQAYAPVVAALTSTLSALSATSFHPSHTHLMLLTHARTCAPGFMVPQGKTYVLPLADKEVDFTETFRLFCTTRLPNPHFTPELSAKVRPCGGAPPVPSLAHPLPLEVVLRLAVGR